MSATTLEAIARECALAIEADHQFGRMEPQRVKDRTKMIAAACVKYAGQADEVERLTKLNADLQLYAEACESEMRPSQLAAVNNRAGMKRPTP